MSEITKVDDIFPILSHGDRVLVTIQNNEDSRHMSVPALFYNSINISKFDPNYTKLSSNNFHENPSHFSIIYDSQINGDPQELDDKFAVLFEVPGGSKQVKVYPNESFGNNVILELDPNYDPLTSSAETILCCRYPNCSKICKLKDMLCVCGNKHVVCASHIIPWNESNHEPNFLLVSSIYQALHSQITTKFEEKYSRTLSLLLYFKWKQGRSELEKLHTIQSIKHELKLLCPCCAKLGFEHSQIDIKSIHQQLYASQSSQLPAAIKKKVPKMKLVTNIKSIFKSSKSPTSPTSLQESDLMLSMKYSFYSTLLSRGYSSQIIRLGIESYTDIELQTMDADTFATYLETSILPSSLSTSIGKSSSASTSPVAANTTTTTRKHNRELSLSSILDSLFTSNNINNLEDSKSTSLKVIDNNKEVHQNIRSSLKLNNRTYSEETSHKYSIDILPLNTDEASDSINKTYQDNTNTANNYREDNLNQISIIIVNDKHFDDDINEEQSNHLHQLQQRHQHVVQRSPKSKSLSNRLLSMSPFHSQNKELTTTTKTTTTTNITTLDTTSPTPTTTDNTNTIDTTTDNTNTIDTTVDTTTDNTNAIDTTVDSTTDNTNVIDTTVDTTTDNTKTIDTTVDSTTDNTNAIDTTTDNTNAIDTTVDTTTDNTNAIDTTVDTTTDNANAIDTTDVSINSELSEENIYDNAEQHPPLNQLMSLQDLNLTKSRVRFNDVASSTSSEYDSNSDSLLFSVVSKEVIGIDDNRVASSSSKYNFIHSFSHNHAGNAISSTYMSPKTKTKTPFLIDDFSSKPPPEANNVNLDHPSPEASNIDAAATTITDKKEEVEEVTENDNDIEEIEIEEDDDNEEEKEKEKEEKYKIK